MKALISAVTVQRSRTPLVVPVLWESVGLEATAGWLFHVIPVSPQDAVAVTRLMSWVRELWGEVDIKSRTLAFVTSPEMPLPARSNLRKSLRFLPVGFPGEESTLTAALIPPFWTTVGWS